MWNLLELSYPLGAHSPKNPLKEVYTFFPSYLCGVHLSVHSMFRSLAVLVTPVKMKLLELVFLCQWSSWQRYNKVCNSSFYCFRFQIALLVTSLFSTLSMAFCHTHSRLLYRNFCGDCAHKQEALYCGNFKNWLHWRGLQWYQRIRGRWRQACV